MSVVNTDAAEFYLLARTTELLKEKKRSEKRNEAAKYQK